MSQDTLSDVLRAVRLGGAVFCYIDGSAPRAWRVVRRAGGDGELQPAPS